MKQFLVITFYLFLTLARGQRVSPDGTCSSTSIGDLRNTCLASQFGNCCSHAGFCGNEDAFCGIGCQPAFGTCSNTPKPLAAIVATQFPSLIIPIAADQPDRAFGTQYAGTLRWDNNGHTETATEIAFDNIPSGTGATSCRLNFYLSRTGPWNIRGVDPWVFGIYDSIGSAVSTVDTWNNHPFVAGLVANVTIAVVDGALSAAVSSHTVPCVVGRAQYLLRPPLHAFNFSWTELKESPTDARNGIVYEMLR